MSWVAVAVAGAGVVGAVASSSASKNAASTQANAAKDANSTQLAMYNQTRADQAPWRSAGENALAKLQFGLGLGPSTSGGVSKTQDNFDSNAYLAANPDVANYIAAHPGETTAFQHYSDFGQNEGRAFTYTPDAQAQIKTAGTAGTSGGKYGDLLRNFSMADYQADPGYAFRQSQGEKAINRSAAAAGRYNSGATLKALDTFNSGLASQEFGNAYNRFNQNQTQQYNKLAGVAGTGQNATQFTDQSGQNAATAIGNNLTSAGAATAAGQIGASNAYTNALGQGLNYWQGQSAINALKPTTSSPYAYDPRTTTALNYDYQ